MFCLISGFCYYFQVFSTRTNCERHIRNRHTESTYSRPELVKLIKFIPKNPADCHAICKYCKKDFVSQKMLKHHLRSPYSSCRRKPFACQLCEVSGESCPSFILRCLPIFFHVSFGVLPRSGASLLTREGDVLKLIPCYTCCMRDSAQCITYVE